MSPYSDEVVDEVGMEALSGRRQSDAEPVDQAHEIEMAGFPQFVEEGDREELQKEHSDALEDWRVAAAHHMRLEPGRRKEYRPRLEEAYGALKSVYETMKRRPVPVEQAKARRQAPSGPMDERGYAPRASTSRAKTDFPPFARTEADQQLLEQEASEELSAWRHARNAQYNTRMTVDRRQDARRHFEQTYTALRAKFEALTGASTRE